jgi:hypothetical protein
MCIEYKKLNELDVAHHFEDAEYLDAEAEQTSSGFGTHWRKAAAPISSAPVINVHWFERNKIWYTPKLKRKVLDLHSLGWIRSERDDDTSFAESRLKMKNWQVTLMANTYYNDAIYWPFWFWKKFGSGLSPIMYVLVLSFIL